MFVFDAREVQLLAVNAALMALNYDCVGETDADHDVSQALDALVDARLKLTAKDGPDGVIASDADIQRFVEEQRVIQAAAGWL